MITSGGGIFSEKNVAIIEVPPYLQPDGHSCVPYCIKMVLDHLSDTYDGVHSLEVDDISYNIGTTSGGTKNNSNIDSINELLLDCVPSIEFVRDHTRPSWDSIISDIEDGKPVICWIESEDDQGKPFGHAVIVKGYENNDVVYNDPLKGEKRENVGVFLVRWEEYSRFALRVKIGERKERKLTEFMEE